MKNIEGRYKIICYVNLFIVLLIVISSLFFELSDRMYSFCVVFSLATVGSCLGLLLRDRNKIQLDKKGRTFVFSSFVISILISLIIYFTISNKNILFIISGILILSALINIVYIFRRNLKVKT